MSARILIVEDDPDLHIGLALRLQAAGYSVLSALHGREALETAEREVPDVMILDIGLPGIGGHEVARELGRSPKTREIPIIFLTARHEPNHRVQASESGAAAYLVKPAKPATILAAVEAAIISREVRAGLAKDASD